MVINNSILNGYQDETDTMDKAQFIQKKCHEIGFNPNNTLYKALNKILEEWNEVREELELYEKDNSTGTLKIQKELGDLLFSTTLLATKLNFTIKDCLKLTIEKFVYRFNYIEQKFKELNVKFENTQNNIDLAMSFWEEAKSVK